MQNEPSGMLIDGSWRKAVHAYGLAAGSGEPGPRFGMPS